MTKVPKAASGVQELIDRLRKQGVEAGREKAEEVLREAERRAAALMAEAKSRAEALLAEARAEIERERSAAHESLRVAIRDTELKMESELKAAFSAHVRRLVSMELRDREFLKQMILAVAGVATGDKVCAGTPAEVLLPKDLFVTDEKGTTLTQEGKDRMRHFVLGTFGEMLREGVELIPSTDIRGGLRVRLVGQDLEIDLSEKALSDLLLKNLLPRYRAIVAGVE